MNADQGDITLDSPEAFLLKTSGFAVAAISTPQIKFRVRTRRDIVPLPAVTQTSSDSRSPCPAPE